MGSPLSADRCGPGRPGTRRSGPRRALRPKQDADRDGYTNVEEYKSGYNPLKHLSSIQEIVYKFRENWSFLIISIILFILIIIPLIYGIKRQKNGSA